MEAVVLIGLQASGKSTFYRERYFATHVRISLDLLNTRHRERRLLEFCLETRQPFVVDNTNPRREDRARYVAPALSAGFIVRGVYFQSRVGDCLIRNASRERPVPDAGVLATSKKLELPTWDEGFQQLRYVRLEEGRFVEEEWQDAV